MDAPRRDRRSAAVDAQLEEFETDLRAYLETHLLFNTDRDHWWEHGRISGAETAGIGRIVAESMAELEHRYSTSEGVMVTLKFCEVLIRTAIWAGMNVPPQDPHTHADTHVEQVVDNALTVYNQNIYALLRTEMIMANHHAEVLQRTWRRCITDPEHPACRRRLMREFESLESTCV